MNIGVLTTMMCLNVAVQNSQRIAIDRMKEAEKSKKVQPTFQSTFNKEKQKERR